MSTIEPRTFPTFRTITDPDSIKDKIYYEKLAYLIKKYGCPITRVSDNLDWIRIYFEIPKDSVKEFLKEE